MSENASDKAVEVLIPAAVKDYAVLPHTVAAVRRLWPEYPIHVVTPTRVVATSEGVSYHLDADALDFEMAASLFKWRPSWCAQQFIKLFNTFIASPYMFVVQGDSVPMRRFSLFDSLGRPKLFTGLKQFCNEYFVFSSAMIGIGKVFSESFITECTLYNRHWISEMVSLADCSSTKQFVSKAAEIIDGSCFPAEQELYGSFAIVKHHAECTPSKLKIHLGGHYRSDGPWTAGEIDRVLHVSRNEDVDYTTLHSWWD